MSTEPENPDGVVIVKDEDTKGSKRMVWIDFQEDPVKGKKKHEVLRVIVGDTQPLVNHFRDNSKLPRKRAALGSCDNGEADVVFVKDDGKNNAVAEVEVKVKDVLVAITEISKQGKKHYPEKIVFAQEFYDLSPANRKAFAKLFR